MSILRNFLLSAFALIVALGNTPSAFAQMTTKPNIVYILCDDLGYGDVHAFNPTRCKIKTPHLDRLASEGMSFTDMHAGSSVCTPSRYGILTGRYSWRTHLQAGVLGGLGKPLIAPNRLTVPELLKENGYVTAAMGKWHLGLTLGPNTYTDPISDGPLQHGFDYFFGISASLDMPPFVYIENGKFTEDATVEKHWVRSGPAGKDFEAINVLPDLTRKAVEYIGGHANSAKAGHPFFLYWALTAPHTPILPTTEWAGKSGIGPYGDFVMQVDDSVGQVLEALRAAGVADNTLVVFTSDNGFAPMAGNKELEAQGHFPSAGFRGYKADIWDGGHRIPFIVRWPGKVKPGTHSDDLRCLTDLMATCADIVGAKIPVNAGEDSISMLPDLLQTESRSPHEAVIHHSNDGYFAIRKGKWKLEFCAGSGGWASPREDEALREKLPPIQLYDMVADSGEKKNVAAEHPEVVAELTALFEKYVHDGRSTPGPTQPNDVRVNQHGAAKTLANAAIGD